MQHILVDLLHKVLIGRTADGGGPTTFQMFESRSVGVRWPSGSSLTPPPGAHPGDMESAHVLFPPLLPLVVSAETSPPRNPCWTRALARSTPVDPRGKSSEACWPKPGIGLPRPAQFIARFPVRHPGKCRSLSSRMTVVLTVPGAWHPDRALR